MSEDRDTPVATVSIEHFRNDPAMQNHEFEMLATLSPGTHALYLHPPASSGSPLAAALIYAQSRVSELTAEVNALRIELEKRA